MKKNFLEEYMKQVEQEGLAEGVIFNETVKNSTADVNLSENDYINNLEKDAMLSESTFNHFEQMFNIDWQHIKKVSEVSETKYGNDFLKNHPHLHDLKEKLRKEADKLK